MDKDWVTTSSTVSVCGRCGGMIDLSKESKTYKVVVEFGDYQITKYHRTLYWCPKCKVFK